MRRDPWANVTIIGLTSLISILFFHGDVGEETANALVLSPTSPLGLLTSAFLHADYWHLIGNMIFLWVFGNAVCGKVGNFSYLVLYFFAALIASLLHLRLDGRPAVGASGAIYGVIGFYVSLYPTNYLYMLWFYFVNYSTFRLRGILIIAAWFLLDLWGAFSPEVGNTAYWAHIGGFLAGAIMGVLVTAMGWVRMSEDEATPLWNLVFRRGS